MDSKTPTKPAIPKRINRSTTAQDAHPRKVLLAGLLLLFIVSVSITLLLAYYVYEPQITGFVQLPTPTIVLTATPQCVRSTLMLGTYIYPLDVISITKEGTIPTLPGPAGSAWWLSDTVNPFVIIFAPAIHSLDMRSALIPGDPIVVQWADCEREEFIYTDLQPGSPDTQALLAQTSSGIAVIIQSIGSSPEYVLHGQRPEQINYPTP